MTAALREMKWSSAAVTERLGTKPGLRYPGDPRDACAKKLASQEGDPAPFPQGTFALTGLGKSHLVPRIRPHASSSPRSGLP
jgi:hypothetical protein